MLGNVTQARCAGHGVLGWPVALVWETRHLNSHTRVPLLGAGRRRLPGAMSRPCPCSKAPHAQDSGSPHRQGRAAGTFAPGHPKGTPATPGPSERHGALISPLRPPDVHALQELRRKRAGWGPAQCTLLCFMHTLQQKDPCTQKVLGVPISWRQTPVPLCPHLCTAPAFGNPARELELVVKRRQGARVLPHVLSSDPGAAPQDASVLTLGLNGPCARPGVGIHGSDVLQSHREP